MSSGTFRVPPCPDISMIWAICLMLTPMLLPAAGSEKVLLDVTKPAALAQVSPSKEGVGFTTPASVEYSTEGATRRAVEITAMPGAKWPGVNIRPASGVFDLTGLQKLQCKVTNTSEMDTLVGVRVDNDADENSITGTSSLPAGATKLIEIPLSGLTSSGKEFDPANVRQVVVFLNGPKTETKVRIESLSAVPPPAQAGPLAERKKFDISKAKLVWSDEFDGDKVDRTKWSVQRGQRKGGYMRSEGAILDGQGHLILRCDVKDGQYGSGFLTTEGKFMKKFGYFEARIKMKQHKGHWPAFWLCATAVNKVGNEGRDGSEIDIMEGPFPQKNVVNHAVHWDGYGADHAAAGTVGKLPNDAPIYDGEWHTYGLDWFENGYVFYIDGIETWRCDAGGVCQVPLGILLTDEIDTLDGKGWTKSSVKDAKLPEDTLIDYVRVYDEVK